jgi:hypothetical protein
VNAAAVLFPFGVRLSTWLAVGAFLALAAYRRDWRPLLAAIAWIWAFEVAFQITSIAAGHHGASAVGRLGYILIGVPVVVCATAWVRPDGWLLAAAALCFVVWISTGFDVNGHAMVSFDPIGEGLNEASKTLLALAYLLPLWWSRRAAATRSPGFHARSAQWSANQVVPGKSSVPEPK